MMKTGRTVDTELLLSWLNHTSVVKIKASVDSPQKLRGNVHKTKHLCQSLWIICDFLQMLFILTWAVSFPISGTKTTITLRITAVEGATVKRIHTVVSNTESWSLSWSNVWWIINQTHYGKAVFTKTQPLYFEFLSQPVRAVHEERCARADGHKTTCSFSREEKNERIY